MRVLGSLSFRLSLIYMLFKCYFNIAVSININLYNNRPLLFCNGIPSSIVLKEGHKITNLIGNSTRNDTLVGLDVKKNCYKEIIRDLFALNGSFDTCIKALNDCDLNGLYTSITNYMDKFSEIIKPLYHEPIICDEQRVLEEKLGSPNRIGDLSRTVDSSSCATDDVKAEYKRAINPPSPPPKYLSTISYDYVTEEPIQGGKVRRRWHREMKSDVYSGIITFVASHRSKFSYLLGMMMKLISDNNDVFMVNEVVAKASELDVPLTDTYYEGCALIYAKSGKMDFALESLEMIMKSGRVIRHKFYESLITYLEEKLDIENLFVLFQHAIEVPKLQIPGFWVGRMLLAILFSAQQKMQGKQGEELAAVYAGMKDNFKKILEIYNTNNLNPVSMPARIGYIVSKIFDELLPNVIYMTKVVPEKRDNFRFEKHGICVNCSEIIPLKLTSDKDRLEIFSQWLSSLAEHNPMEVVNLANLYKKLADAIIENRPYTAILDGQNIAHHSRTQYYTQDLFSVEKIKRIIEERGERALIILPLRLRCEYNLITKDVLKYFFSNSREIDNEVEPVIYQSDNRIAGSTLELVRKWIDKGSIFMCNPLGYDDNHLFLSGIVNFSDDEFQIFANHLKKALSSLNAVLIKNVRNNENPVSNFIPLNKSPTPLYRNDNIIVTNDTLDNFNIPGADEEVLEIWKSQTLTSFTFYRDTIVGYRLKYSLNILNNEDSPMSQWHIPLGYERINTDYKRKFKIIHKNEPIIPSITHPFIELSDGNAKNCVKDWITKHEYDKLLEDENIRQEEKPWNQMSIANLISNSRAPEVQKLKYNSKQQSRWLCINLKHIDHIVDNIVNY